MAGPLSYKRLWFLGLEHITPKIRCGPYRIWSAASVLPSSVGWIHEKSQENLENLRLGKTEGKIFAILIEFMKVGRFFCFVFSYLVQ